MSTRTSSRRKNVSKIEEEPKNDGMEVVEDAKASDEAGAQQENDKKKAKGKKTSDKEKGKDTKDAADSAEEKTASAEVKGSSPSSKAKGKKKAKAESDIDKENDKNAMEEEEAPSPQKKGRKVKVSATESVSEQEESSVTPKKSKRTKKAKKNDNMEEEKETEAEEEEEEEEDEKEEDDADKKGKKKKRSRSRTPKKDKQSKNSEDENDAENGDTKDDGEDGSAKKKKKKRTPPEPRGPPPGYKMLKVGETKLKPANSFTILSFNVNGLRAAVKNDLFATLKHENADIVCLSETKIDEEELKKTQNDLIFDSSYHVYWSCCRVKKGYAGTAILTKIPPLNVYRDFVLNSTSENNEGRLIIMEFEPFYLIHTYVPNSGEKLERLDYRTTEWDENMRNLMQELNKKKPTIWMGDLNVAPNEIDLFNPKTNKNSAGFTQKERDSFAKTLSLGYVDVFRHFNPTELNCYTYFGNRQNNRERGSGWRLDHAIVPKSAMDQGFIQDIWIGTELNKEGKRMTDHLPLIVQINDKFVPTNNNPSQAPVRTTSAGSKGSGQSLLSNFFGASSSSSSSASS